MLNVMYNAYPSSTYFTLKMHHGGHFKENSYIGGKVAFYDYCDHEKMSCIVLSDMGQKLGYTLPFGFYFKDENDELQWILHDDYVYNAAKDCLNHGRVLEVFLTLPKNNPPNLTVENEDNDPTETEKQDEVNAENVVNEETEVEDMVNEETEVEEEVDIDVGVNEGVEGEATDFVDEDYIARDDEDLYDTCINNEEEVEGGVNHNEGKKKCVAEENDDVIEDVENERVVLDEE